MIKSETGLVTVKGNVLDIIFECHHLFNAFIEDNPEIIAAVVYKSSDSLHDAIEKCNPEKLSAIEKYIDHIEQVSEDIEDED